MVELNDKLPSPRTGHDIEAIAGNLPTIGSCAESKVLLTRLSQVHQSRSSLSATERQDEILISWAMLLHTYLVSEMVVFCVIGMGEKQLVRSYCPLSTSGISTSDLDPRLTFAPFEDDKHRSQVNTAVTFKDVEDSDGMFSYIAQSSKKVTSDLRLYTQQACVPRKFASALWNTLCEIHSNLMKSTLQNWRKTSISGSDIRTLRSFSSHTSFDSYASIHDLWLQSFRTVPLATAVESWDGTFTYAELDELSNKVADQLVTKGVRRGDFVPFSFEKSCWMVVAVLGIVKAGAAFAAIDPSQPRARADQVMDQLRAAVMVVSPKQATVFVDMGIAVLVVSSDHLKQNVGKHPRSRSRPEIRAEDPAVCIFTSGSTGNPKGIVVQHQALAARMLGEGGSLEFQGAKCLQFAASTWDIFITEIFATLAYQGCVCIPKEEDRLFNLSEFCNRHHITHAIITPTLANMMDPASFTTLKVVVFSGEALRSDVVAKWSSRPNLSLYQGYGPAETGGCIIGPLAPRAEILGHALENYSCVLVDPENHDRLVPIGAVGELLVAGPSILQEYIHDPVRTSAAFIENPSWGAELDIDETRFYKTGDLLRYSIDTLDGSLEFVGRTDNQVKFHGQRIELGEIEHHLGQFPKVINSVAHLPKRGSLKGRLVAVVQLNSSSDPPHSAPILAIHEDSNLMKGKINKFLSSCLPAYMIPSEIFVVKNMPLNASMKLDRASINKWILDMPAEHMKISSCSSSLSEASPLSDHESTARAIASIYASIVTAEAEHLRPKFENHDFNLQSGGIDSVQIMSFSRSLKDKFGIQIPIDQMLSSKSTVRSIAAIIETGATEHSSNSGTRGSETTSKDIEDLLQSVLLSPVKMYRNPDVKSVLLTGAAGYLGIEILRQLLTQSTCQIYALVRGSSQEAARHRLIQKAMAANWWSEEYHSRLEVWMGDLSQPQLAITTAQWRILQGQGGQGIDAIVHNGAKVHYHTDYDSLKATNVSSTIELLKAINGREKRLHSFVFVSGGQQLSFDDDDDDANLQSALSGSGYPRSKAVSELLVRKFAEQAQLKVAHVRIVKPGFIIGDSDRGVANKNDFIWRYIAASIEIGAYDMKSANGWLFVADVSRVSEVILESVFGHEKRLAIKILDGIQFQDIWLLLQNEFGYRIRPVSQSEWLFKLRQIVATKQEEHVLFPLMHMFDTDIQSIGVLGRPKIASSGIKETLLTNINNLVGNGFFKTPKLSSSDSSSIEDLSTPISSMANSLVLAQDAFDVKGVRKGFPALQEGVVAFNNAAGTAVYQGAIDCTQKYMSAFPIEVGLDDPRSKRKTEVLTKKIATLAKFMNAEPDEIAFGQSTTMLLRILGQALRPGLNLDCEIILSNLCHEASAAAWISLAKDLNVAVKWWSPPPGDNPTLSLETLKPLLTSKTRIVACNHVSNVVGTIHPIRKIADMVHAIPGAIFIVDGVAWAPHRPIDVKALDVDFYCFSWYKVFGPHIAQLYGRRSVQERCLTGISHFFLGGYPGLDWRLRLGSPAFELEAALVAVSKYLDDVGWEKIIAQETVLQEVLLSYLRQHPHIFRIFGEKSSCPQKRVAVITFQVIGKSSRDIMNRVNQQTAFRIVSGHCWSPRPTHDVLRLEMDGLVRISLVHYNTVEEVRTFCAALQEILK